MRGGRREGMALLTVLLLVTAMAAVAVAILDETRFAVRRTANLELQSQAQWYASGAEALARSQIARLVEADAARTPVEPAWNGRSLSFPLDDGTIRATLSDGQACFNLNSVVEGQGEDLIARPEGGRQLARLARAVGVADGKADALAAALTDWLDADGATQALGAEDGAYAAMATPYRTGGVMLAEVSELRAVKGVDADVYRRLRPFVCALPTSRAAVLNLNSLTPRHWPLLAMLSESGLAPERARQALANRPRDGWRSAAAFWSQPALAGAGGPEAVAQTGLTTRFFDLRVDVDLGGMTAVRTSLLDAAPGLPVRTVMQRWIVEE